ncbi:MAG: sigma 54-interacting transcriptional regulator [Clostridiaceae bacterium]|nr:sigma 54-interacting transcriptional regulator [Clostridiaceae bacterium]
MNLRIIGELLEDFTSGIVLVNDRGIIEWASRYVRKEFNNGKPLKKVFSDVFPINLEEIMLADRKVKDPNGKSYSVRIRKIAEGENIHYFVFLESIQDFKNKDTRIFCLEKIIDTISEGIVMSDYDGKVVIYNEANGVLDDMNPHDAIGKYIWEAYKYNKEDKSEHRQVFNSGDAIINKYRAHSYKNGIPRYVSYNTYPIIKDEEKVGVFSVCQNITKLQSLLSETIELKRKYAQKESSNTNSYDSINGTSYTFSDIVGNSKPMVNLIKEAQTIALLDNNILIIGDTGTGKEVFAQSIHNFGKRSNQPFIGISCAAIPENLLESILFGAVKGAYTGAVDHQGLFEEAGEGTLFLDELNSMPATMQSKLLRVLQERKVRRVGGVSTVNIQCRVISAVNEDPQMLIHSGRLRQDLFYRIAGLCLFIPPLQDRKEDILGLSEYFINKYNRLMNKNIKRLSSELKDAMLSYYWPGNIRELEHVIENIMIRTGEYQKELNIKNMPQYLRETFLGYITQKKARDNSESLTETLKHIEKKIILEGLKRNKWNISKTAKDLGIIRQSLIYRIKKLDIKNTSEQ